MATIICPCCRVEISAEAARCYTCEGRPPLLPGQMIVEYDLSPSEQRRIDPACPHRSRD